MSRPENHNDPRYLWFPKHKAAQAVANLFILTQFNYDAELNLASGIHREIYSLTNPHNKQNIGVSSSGIYHELVETCLDLEPAPFKVLSD